MTENQLAVSASKAVLEKVGDLTGTAVKDMVEPVSRALVAYGCRDQLLIMNVLKETVPAFEKISRKFFEVLYQTVEIAEKTEQENFEIILNAIFIDENADIETKVEIVRQLLAEQNENKNRRLDIVVKGSVTTISVVLAAFLTKTGMKNMRDYGVKKVIQQGKTERLKIRMEVLREFSPAGVLKEIGNLIKKQ